MSDAHPPEHDLVKIQGLKVRSDLNGLFASIVNKEPHNGRILIEVCSTDERVLIKSENVTPCKGKEDEGERKEVYADDLLKLSDEERFARIALNTEKLKRMPKTDPKYDELDLETYTLRRLERDRKRPAKRKVASIKFFGGDQDFSDDDDDGVDYRTPKFEDDDNDNVDYRTPKFEEAGNDSDVYRSVPIP